MIDVIPNAEKRSARVRQQQFMLDVVETILYITAFFAIITDVFGVPLTGVLATSGALAIVLRCRSAAACAELLRHAGGLNRERSERVGALAADIFYSSVMQIGQNKDTLKFQIVGLR